MRPTISLCCIAKNEESNIRRLTESIQGCFDELILTDTGSTDKTVELAKELGWKVSHFDWIQDFAAARNYSYKQATSDYIMWLDLDDVLLEPDNFKLWRDNAMGLCDFWLATYDYAHGDDGKAIVSFSRERVSRRSKGHEWQFFIHEGLEPKSGDGINFISTWRVSHKRTIEDVQRDRGRNISIFEYHKNKTDFVPRMKFYYGKELFEANRPNEAFEALNGAIKEELQMHDRVMGIQYCIMSALQIANNLEKSPADQEERAKKLQQAVILSHQGIQLDSHRAEFWTSCGDALVKLGRMNDAAPYYAGAAECRPNGQPGQKNPSASFNFKEHFTTYPRQQLARVYFNTGRIDDALRVCEQMPEEMRDGLSLEMLEQIKKVRDNQTSRSEAKECDDIVITCPPGGMYEWDEVLYKTKGMGGSETAAIEMAKNLRKVTGRNVKVFNQRSRPLVADSGVEYIPTEGVTEYFSKYKPKVHIAWRHNFKVTDAPTYLWCHDLLTPSAESAKNFDQIICLSPFHKNYVKAMQGIKDDDIWVSRNGIVPERFKDVKNIKKNPMKLCFPSSPDRGLDNAILTLDLVREDYPNIELHVFYGFDNLYKSGPQMSALADKIKAMIAERPWIKSHGFTEQTELTRHFMESSIWFHPANFIETFCITALEMICSGVFPVTRNLGALPDTLHDVIDKGWAKMLDHDCVTDLERYKWADAIKEALWEQSWTKIDVSPELYSWESVAKEWAAHMKL